MQKQDALGFDPMVTPPPVSLGQQTAVGRVLECVEEAVAASAKAAYARARLQVEQTQITQQSNVDAYGPTVRALNGRAYENCDFEPPDIMATVLGN